jgi:hypothetical protein
MIQWTLTEQQADHILQTLHQRPYVEVAGLIGVLMQQVQQQQLAANQPQTGQRIAGTGVAKAAQEQQVQRSLGSAAESNSAGSALPNGQAAPNGLDQSQRV